MSNNNILEGWKCPECGNEDDFAVQAITWAELTDNGAEAGDIEYDENSDAYCGECGHAAKVSQFS